MILGVGIFAVATMLPGILLSRMLRASSVLYAFGLGVLFNLVVGLVANFTMGITPVGVIGIYITSTILLAALSWKFGSKFQFKWTKSAVIPLLVYILAAGMQLQTTLMSPNLVGSDIHLEYYYARWTLQDGFWNPDLALTTMTSALGVTVLLPVYKILTGIDLIWVFKIIPALMMAVLPVVVYQVFKKQFGTVIAFLSSIFFIAMPMWTMDLPQLVRQGQSELFFVLVLLVVVDDMAFVRKLLFGGLFAIAAVVMHYGMAIGFIGYVFVSGVLVYALAWLWRKKVADAQRPLLLRVSLLFVAVIAVVTYVVYYSNVNGKISMWASSIPSTIAQRTIVEAQAGVTDKPMDSIAKPKELSKTYGEAPSTPVIKPVEQKIEQNHPSLIERFPFLSPFWREPLVQTAIGLDFGRASTLGKVWRVLQYLVEACLVVGFIVMLLKPRKEMRLEYMAMVVTSFFVLAGLYVLSTYSYGMGAARIWQITLLFMSPCFVLGAGAIGQFVTGRKALAVTLVSMLALFVPYFLFNSGLVFELAKMNPVGFIDVPYSIALSANRVDVVALFEEEDVEAVDWFKENIDGVIYADANGVKLLIQRMGITQDFDLGTSMAGQIRLLEKMKPDATGYIYMRKQNVDDGAFTFQGEYASREQFSIDGLEMVKGKLDAGVIVFDNGARVVAVR